MGKERKEKKDNEGEEEVELGVEANREERRKGVDEREQ